MRAAGYRGLLRGLANGPGAASVSVLSTPPAVTKRAAAVPYSIFKKNPHFLVVDLETQQLAEDVGGWNYVHDLTVSVACAYDSSTSQFLTFRENELGSLIDLCAKRLVVGFNFRFFDGVVLQKYGFSKGIEIFDIKSDIEGVCCFFPSSLH